ncbi:MAG: apolipoprotein N-acyltransferase [Pseudomonadota bacterium]
MTAEDALPLSGMSTRRRRWAALAAGVFAGAGQAPFDLWFVALPSLALLCLLHMGSVTRREAALTTYLGALGYFALTLFWIVEPFLVDVGRHGWMAPFALLFLSAGLALLWGAAGLIARVVLPAGHRLDPLAWAVLLTVSEVVRSHLLTGFPWVLPGYMWEATPIAQWFAFFGPHGMNFLTFAVACGLAAAILAGRRGWIAAGCGLAALAGAAILTAVSLPAAVAPDGPIIRVVQPNAEQHLKWQPNWRRVFLERAITLTGAEPLNGGQRPDIIVWPETSVPSLLSMSGPVFEAVSTAAGEAEVVLGIQRRQGEQAFNSLVLLNDQGALGAIYDKHHLVPFGEYMPMRDTAARLGLRAFADQLGRGYTAGPPPRPITFANAGPAMPLICYEAIFPQLVGGYDARPDWIIQITNDAWFGKVSGPYQHLAQARLRAIEQGLPLVRAANTGVSAIIDAHGRTVAEIALGEAGFADAALPSPRPPTIYSRTGDLPAYLAMALCFSGLIVARRTLS